MDAILASIRTMIAEDEGAAADSKTADNVSPLFAETKEAVGDVSPPVSSKAAEPSQPQPAKRPGTSARPAVERAVALAIKEARVEFGRDTGSPVNHTPIDNASTTTQTSVGVQSSEPTTMESKGSPAEPGDLMGGESPPHEGAEVAGKCDDHLVSAETEAVVSEAFDTLAVDQPTAPVRTVDGLIEELLRPMLREWLDKNLPPLVERLVRDEIERLSRQTR
ncbi:DUF2497 domain-containing protein [Bauldia sp.]|uniref:DUF2497 domain-containing protein n=1 Tax=Bauldia sp. TaxID=2575872 RepID=UPI003BAD4ECC